MLRDAVLTSDCQLYYDYLGPHDRNLFGEPAQHRSVFRKPSGSLLKSHCSCRNCLNSMTAIKRVQVSKVQRKVQHKASIAAYPFRCAQYASR
jgi:hypothetical protein